MLGFSYLPEHMGTATLTPAGPFVAGTHVALVLTYTSGQFGIDDSGDLKVVWRGTSDMGKPQFTDPTAANYTTVEASNGAVLEARRRSQLHPALGQCTVDQGRPRLSARRRDHHHSPRRHAARARRACACKPMSSRPSNSRCWSMPSPPIEFTELLKSPEIALVAGPAAAGRRCCRAQNIAGEKFRLCIVAEDRWGNPTAEASARLKLTPVHRRSPDCRTL